MLADDVLQPMYDLAYFLYPDPAVALTVTLDAADRLALLRRLREHPTGHAWRRLPEAWLPQYCVYLASDGPERAHERPRPGRAPRERPTRDDYVVRYVKCLVWWTMDRTACHVAVALGCFLYCYSPGALVRLAPALCDPFHIRRIRVRLRQQLQARFPRVHFFPGDHRTRRTRLPTAHDRQLVQRALAMFTPWGEAHVPPPALDHSLLDAHFDQASARSDWDRIHALINPVDAGLPRLIREYNAPFPPGVPGASPSQTSCWRSRALPRDCIGRPVRPAMRPRAVWRARDTSPRNRDLKESHMPFDPVPPVSGDGQPGARDRFHPATLSPTAVAGLQQSLARQQRRRHAYRAGPLRVGWDGGAQQQVDPRGGVCEPCRVPLSASYLEIAGDDTEGALLLAVVPLPDPEEVGAEGTQHLSVTLEGGQTVALTLALDQGSDGQMPVYVIQLTYLAAAAPMPLLPRPHPETSIPPQEGGLPAL